VIAESVGGAKGGFVGDLNQGLRIYDWFAGRQGSILSWLVILGELVVFLLQKADKLWMDE